MVLLGITIVSRPDVLFVVPLRLLSLCRTYFYFLLDRLIRRAEFELTANMLGWAPNGVTSSPPVPASYPGSTEAPHGGQHPHVPAPQVPAGYFGWLVALAAWSHKH